MTDASSAWRAYLAASAAGTYGAECASLRDVADVVECHFLDARDDDFASTHLPRLRDALSRADAASAAPGTIDDADDDATHGWVDAAVPAAVDAFARAIADARARAANLATALHASDPRAAEHARARLDAELAARVGAGVATRGPARLSSVVATYFSRRLTEFERALAALRGRDPDGDDDAASDDDAAAAAAGATMDLDRPTPPIFSCKDALGAPWADAVAAVATGVGGGREWTERHEARDDGGCALGAVAEAAVAKALELSVRKTVSAKAKGVFDRRALPRLLRWLDAVPLQFLATTLGMTHGAGGPSGRTDAAATASKLAEWRSRLEYAIHEHLGALRVSEFFDVIVEFPDSVPAVRDLRACLRRTTLHAQLVRRLRSAMQSRLLVAGAPTADIIEQYRLTIRALRALDPSGVVLRVVSGPLKEYLRERKDTIRCVVTMLMGGGGGGGDGDGGDDVDALLGADGDDAVEGSDDEIDRDDVGAGWEGPGGDGGGGSARGGPRRAMEAWENDPEFTVDLPGGVGGAGRPEAGAAATATPAATAAPEAPKTPASKPPGGHGWDEWEPEPVESEAASSRGRRRRAADELGHLIGIYGSKELLVNEYRNMLAERLLSKVGYDVDREMHTLELLKLRFGESSLHKCEVMLKDVLGAFYYTLVHVRPRRRGARRSSRIFSSRRLSPPITRFRSRHTATPFNSISDAPLNATPTFVALNDGPSTLRQQADQRQRQGAARARHARGGGRRVLEPPPRVPARRDDRQRAVLATVRVRGAGV